MPYLTPDELPGDTICRALIIPNDRQFLGCVTGALQELTFAYNWENFGNVSPEEAASAMREMFDDFCFNSGVCRVIGEIIPYGGTTSPDANWLVCDGSSLVRADYAELFAIIGTAYGSVDSSHFNIPDLRGRAAIGSGQGTGLSNRTLGVSTGAEQHTLSTAEMPQHTHTDIGHSHGYAAASPLLQTPGPGPGAFSLAAATAPGYASLTLTGGSNAHNNMQPSLVINYLIVAKQ